MHCTAVLLPSAETGGIPSLYMTDLGLHLTHPHTFPGADAAIVMMKERQGTNAQGTPDGELILVPPHCSRCCDSSTWPSSMSVRATHKSSWSFAIQLRSCGQFYLSPLTLPLKHRFGCRGSMANIKEVAKNCQRQGGVEAPQNNTPTFRQRVAGAKAVSQGLSCCRGAADQQILQGMSITPAVGGGINWELRY